MHVRMAVAHQPMVT